MKSYKFSKTYIAAFMYRFAFLLFVPFLQGLFFANQGAIKLFTVYFTDLAVAFFLFCVAVIRYKKGRLTLKEKSFDFKRGAVFRIEEKSLISKKGSLTVTEALFLRLFKGSKLRLFSGTSYSTVYLKNKDAREILESLTLEAESCRFSSGIFRSLLMSVSFSNALTGLLAAAPLLRRVSAVLGARQTALVLDGASLEGLLRFTGFPPILSRVSSLLFLCWVVGLSTEFFREYDLAFRIYDSVFKVSKGLITKTTAVFSKDALRALVFRQSLLMFLLGFYSAEVRLNIRPSRKIHVLSAATRSRCEDLEEVLAFKKEGKKYSIFPPEDALWGYTYLPVIFLFLDSILLILFNKNYIVKTVAVVLLVVFLVWFNFRFVAFFSASLSIWDNFAEIKYFSGMNFTRSVFRLKDIIGMEITQSVFQRKSGRCNLIIKIGNTKALKLKIKHLKLCDVEKTASFFGSGFVLINLCDVPDAFCVVVN